ncbi:MAG TPA: hypothetical protein V6D05_10280, partial [Stenomitos sp.]
MAAGIALKQPLASNPDLFMGQPETSKLLETVDHRLGYGLPERSPLTLVGLHVDPQGGYERVPPEALKRFRARLLTLLTRALPTREGERLPDELFWLPPYYYVVLPETDQFQCL